jgi:phosphoenolpyruvate synthase/pyruvate phosphate dikinase
VLSSLRNRLKTKNLIGLNLNDEDKMFFKKEQKKILSKTSKKIKGYVDLIHELGLARMKIKSCWAGLDYYLIPLIKEIAKRTGENITDINKYYVTDDIKRLLLTKKKVSQEEKKRRQFCFVGVWKNNKLVFKSGEPALVMAKAELGDLLIKKETKELRGAVANSGKTRAIARILFSNNIESMKKIRREFKKGQVLVTQMTQPNIFDIAKKAGAIVTDEGGMLSHAAIISRELKIPCIVGTSVATDLIKDGQLIEVDANKGVVRIIK